MSESHHKLEHRRLQKLGCGGCIHVGNRRHCKHCARNPRAKKGMGSAHWMNRDGYQSKEDVIHIRKRRRGVGRVKHIIGYAWPATGNKSSYTRREKKYLRRKGGDV